MISFSPEVVPALMPCRRRSAGRVQDVGDDDVHGRGSKSEIVAQGRGDLFLDVAGHVVDGPVIVHRDRQVHDGGATQYPGGSAGAALCGHDVLGDCAERAVGCAS